MKESNDGVVVVGDGRHDSMGHSAKYCAYTIFCCNVLMIIHFDIVHVVIIYQLFLPLVYNAHAYLPIDINKFLFVNYSSFTRFVTPNTKVCWNLS